MKRSLLTLLTLLVFSSSVWAKDMVTTWIGGGGNPMKLSFRDDRHIRMETGDKGYILLIDEKVYMVTQENGQWQAFDMDQMAGMMKAFGLGMPGGAQDAKEDKENKLKDSGRSEVVAGYKGKVYLADQEKEDGGMQAVEVVLSTHADIKQVNRAWMALSTRLGKIMGEDMAKSIEQAADESQRQGYGGLLRHGDDIKLSKLEKISLKDDDFKLPQGVVLVQMPQQPPTGGAPARPDGTQAQPSETMESGTAADTAVETDRNSSDGIKEEIDKGVRNLFKKLF